MIVNRATDKKKGLGLRIFLFLFGVISGCIAATQSFAHLMNYDAALGNPIISKMYFPFDIIKWYVKWGSLAEAERAFNLAISVGVVVVAVIFLFASIALYMRKNKGVADLHGSARFATIKEIEKMGLLNQEGVIVGSFMDKGKERILLHNGPEHILCVAPTRSGKGVGPVNMSLLYWKHSVVVTDLKGELWAITAGWRKKHANNYCLKFEPSAENSCRWNPLDEVRIDEDENVVGDVQNIANLIVDPDGKGLEDHWQKTSYALLTGCILHLLYKRKKDPTVEATLSAVDHMLANPDLPLPELWDEMITFGHVDGKPSPTVQRAAQDMKDRPANEAGSVLSTAKSFLALYRDPMIQKNTAFSSFNIKNLMNSDKPVSLYIVTQPNDKTRLKSLVRLLVSMIVRVQASKMEYVRSEPKPYTPVQKIFRKVTFRSTKNVGGGVSAKGVYKHKQLLMLDEFPSLGKLDIMQESLAFIAGYGMKGYLICQDLGQLRSEKSGYGHDEAISSNCHVQNFYPPNKMETAEYVSKMTGTTTVVKETATRSTKMFGSMNEGVQVGVQESQRALLTPDEIRTLPGPKKAPDGRILEAGDMLVFMAGFHPIYGKQPLFFKHDMFLKRSLVVAPEKSDEIHKEGKNFKIMAQADEAA